MGDTSLIADPKILDILQSEQVAVFDEQVQSVVSLQSDNETVTVTIDSIVVLNEAETDIIQLNAAGPQGIPGTSGTTTTKIAGTAIGGHRAVILDAAGLAHYADNQTLSHRDSVYGITLNAAGSGSEIQIEIPTGGITEPSWNWTPQQPIWLGANGTLTQTVPSSPAVFRRIIAFATTATQIVVGFREPITL